MPGENASSDEKAAKRARKLAKRARRRAEKEQLSKDSQLDLLNRPARKARKQALSERAREDKRNKKSGLASGWQVSDAVGGYLVDVDPVFSVDEQ